MAEFKTAEQYVVEKVEMLERELDSAKIEHQQEVRDLTERLIVTQSRLDDALDLLNSLRDFIGVRSDAYFGNIIDMSIYGKEHPEVVARILEYFDMEDEEDA